MSSNISDVSKGSSPTLPALPNVVLMAAASSATNADNIVSANYTKLSESLRRLTPQRIQCSVFCGGAHCKYETPDNWTKDSLAIQGIYSNWITDNILAMARPSTYVIIQKNIIQQFQSIDIKSIINLQTPREHASCGYPLESSGFTYDPNIFMENNIYYYNFSWKDYGEATMLGLLNMVKVVAFAASEGRIAIHCHAGLGRTGVLIACYLVYSLRVHASAAIRFVRMKRPGSVQTRGQILCIRHFAHFISPQTITYYLKDHTDNDKYMVPFTLTRFLRKQKIALHGYEERIYKFLPKILHKICQRILQLCGCFYDDFPASNVPLTSEFICSKLTPNVKRHESIYSLTSTCSDSLLSPDTALSPSGSNFDLSSVASSPSSPNPSESSFDLLDGDSVDYPEEDIFENRCFQELEQHKHFTEKDSAEEQLQLHDVQDVAEILITTDVNALKPEIRKRLHASMREINISQIGWLKLERETDLHLLVALLFEWLEKLKQPVLDRECLETIVIFQNQTEVCFSKFNSDSAVLVEYLIRFLTKLQPVSRQLQEDLLLRMAASLAQQTVVLRDVVLPHGKNFKKLRDGTKECILHFLSSLYSMVDITWRKKKSASTYALDNSEDELDNVESGYCGETC